MNKKLKLFTLIFVLGLMSTIILNSEVTAKQEKITTTSHYEDELESSWENYWEGIGDSWKDTWKSIGQGWKNAWNSIGQDGENTWSNDDYYDDNYDYDIEQVVKNHYMQKRLKFLEEYEYWVDEEIDEGHYVQYPVYDFKHLHPLDGKKYYIENSKHFYFDENDKRHYID